MVIGYRQSWCEVRFYRVFFLKRPIKVCSTFISIRVVIQENLDEVRTYENPLSLRDAVKGNWHAEFTAHITGRTSMLHLCHILSIFKLCHNVKEILCMCQWMFKMKMKRTNASVWLLMDEMKNGSLGRSMCGLDTETIKVRLESQWKQNFRFGEFYTCFGYETKTAVERISIIFQHRPMFSYINGKLSPRPTEWYGWT